MRGMPAIALVLITLLLTAAASAADTNTVIYKWQDGHGRIHYGQTPPSGIHAVIVKIRHATVDTKAARKALQDRLKDLETDRQARHKAATQASIEADNARIREQNCETAHGNLQQLTTHNQVSVKDGGQYRVLSEQARQRRIAKAKANIDRFCNREAAAHE